MVEQSELAWRLLSRRHSPEPTLCYTPMFHSRLFATTPIYRQQSFNPSLDGHAQATRDRPLIVQFCSNEPQDLLDAAVQVQDYCDAVDLNLGCPQGIAKKGNYGAFLQEYPDLIQSLIQTLHRELKVPVTAKFRILETKEKSLAYAKMIVAAGASVITVHGRQRHQKGHNTGLADWSVLKYIRDNIPKDVVMFANGNILWQEDVERCIAETGVDGVMSAEGNLYNPAVFQPTTASWDARFPRMDLIATEYLAIIRDEILPHIGLKELYEEPDTKRSKKRINEVLKDPSLTAMKSHFFKIYHSLLPKFPSLRAVVGQASTRNSSDPLKEYAEALETIKKIIADELAANPEPVDADGHWTGPDTELAEGEEIETCPEKGIHIVEHSGKKWKRVVPWYRCQPYVRPLPEEAYKRGAMTEKGKSTMQGGTAAIGEGKARKVEALEEDLEDRRVKRAKTGVEGSLAEVAEEKKEHTADVIMGEAEKRGLTPEQVEEVVKDKDVSG